jgi:hypothetical protein
MKNYPDKIKAIIDLQQRGYELDFIMKGEFLFCPQQNRLISPDEFEVTETYQFKENKGKVDMCVIYGIQSLQTDLKGILMTSYRAFSFGLSIHLWSKLSKSLKT